MNRFEPGVTNAPKTFKEFLKVCRAAGVKDKAEIMNTWRYQQRCEDWVNDIYHVSIDKEPETPLIEHTRVWHLSIKRHDREPIRDWRDMQEIKNQLVGPECEAVELYPAESRLMDTSNQYHLWALPDAKDQFPIGYFSARAVTDNPNMGDAKQRPGADRNKRTDTS